MYIYYFYNYRIKLWKKVEGKILDSGPEYFVSETDVDTAGWKYKVLYKYKIDDKEYFSNVIGKNMGILLPWEESVNKYENKYIKGEVVTVYYSPNNPRDSVIDDRFSYTSLLPLFMGSIAVFVAIYLWTTGN